MNFTICSNFKEYEYVQTLAKHYGFDLTVARINTIGRSSNNKNVQNYLHCFLREYDPQDIKFSNVVARCQLDEKHQLLSHKCGAGLASLCINANGDVTICGSAKKVYGNVYKDSVYNIWNNDELKAFRSLKWLPVFCKNCNELINCLGGCKAELEENEEGKSKDSIVTNSLKAVIKDYNQYIVRLNFAMCRKIDDQYVLFTKPLKIVDEDVYKVVMNIHKARSFEHLLELANWKHKVFELENLIYSLVSDRVITINKNKERKDAFY